MHSDHIDEYQRFINQGFDTLSDLLHHEAQQMAVTLQAEFDQGNGHSPNLEFPTVLCVPDHFHTRIRPLNSEDGGYQLVAFCGDYELSLAFYDDWDSAAKWAFAIKTAIQHFHLKNSSGFPLERLSRHIPSPW
jgi:hypothetical protein